MTVQLDRLALKDQRVLERLVLQERKEPQVMTEQQERQARKDQRA
jgi:hypothetical protein